MRYLASRHRYTPPAHTTTPEAAPDEMQLKPVAT